MNPSSRRVPQTAAETAAAAASVEAASSVREANPFARPAGKVPSLGSSALIVSDSLCSPFSSALRWKAGLL